MTINHRIFLKVDLVKWVYGTVDKHQSGQSWSDAWWHTYQEIGGLSINSGQKGCPMEAARVLYTYGRLKNANKPYRESSTKALWNYSKNGTYAILATRLLSEYPNLSVTELWCKIRSMIVSELGDNPATSEQGGPTLTYKLWFLGYIKID